MFDYAVTVRSLLLLLGLVATYGFAQSPNPARGVKPLFRDPVYDGAADPVVVWNPHVKRWWMFYTNRRANAPGLSGVAWVHGTRIGIAESADLGATWSYAGTADIELPPDIRGAEPTLWAPDVFTAPDGAHHMFLTVVPGVFENWQHPRTIVHLTSADLRSWRRARPLSLASDRVIDAAALQLADGSWRMWYNNERDGKSIYYADSRDLLAWNDRGKAVGDQGGEGPVVFRWRNAYWMITDVWDGLAVYRSTDAASWSRQAGENLLQRPGRGADDQVKGGHPDVVVDDATGRAFLFYFTHPGRSDPRGPADGYDQRRSSIQVVELEERDGRLTCDRDAATSLRLTPPATGPGLARQTPEYLFAYFTGNDEDGLHFARSTDGLKWTEIAGGRSFLKPAVGSSLMRDPSIARGPDGTFHLVWTTGWWDRGIGIAHSKNLIDWSDQRFVPVMEHEPDAQNCWAPEIFFDDDRERYLIVWSTTIPGRFRETDPPETAGLSRGDRANHRIYYVETRDFRTFSRAQLLYDGGFNVIDAFIVKAARDRYVMVVKDETLRPTPKKHLRVTEAKRPDGPYGPASAPVSIDWVEGPSALKVGTDWIVYYDEYTRQRYGAIRSRNLTTFDVVPDVGFPAGARHGTAFPVPPEIAAQLGR